LIYLEIFVAGARSQCHCGNPSSYFVISNLTPAAERRQVIDLTAFSWLRGRAANVITTIFPA
jgi:hypothetical protein